MNKNDTSLGAGQSQFPSTIWDVLSSAAGPDLNTLTARYWRPVYRFIRGAWKKPVEDAKDLTQEFFATVFTREFLAGADRARGNFRKFVLASLRNFLTNQYRAEHRQKRGGGSVPVALDAMGAEDRFEAGRDEDPDRVFDRAWAAEILDRSVRRLEELCAERGVRKKFEAFRWYCLEESDGAVTYKDVARKLGMTEGEVTHAIFEGRRELRTICAQFVAETVQDPTQIEQEMALLFGRSL